MGTRGIGPRDGETDHEVTCMQFQGLTGNSKRCKVLVSVLLLFATGYAWADPPPWAPAHGYRGKQPQYQDDATDYPYGGYYLPWLAQGYTGNYVGAGRCYREKLGAVVGAMIGGTVGSQIANGKNRTVAALTGAVIGVLVGQSIGRSMDAVDQNCTGQTLEYAPDYASVSWRDPNSGNLYTVTPLRTYPAN